MSDYNPLTPEILAAIEAVRAVLRRQGWQESAYGMSVTAPPEAVDRSKFKLSSNFLPDGSQQGVCCVGNTMVYAYFPPGDDIRARAAELRRMADELDGGVR